MEEVNGAELGAVLASSGTAGVDGEVRRSEVDRSSARVPARGEERRAGEKGGEGGTAAGGLLYHAAGERGGPGDDGPVVDTAAPRHWRHAVRAVATVMVVFRNPPRQI